MLTRAEIRNETMSEVDVVFSATEEEWDEAIILDEYVVDARYAAIDAHDAKMEYLHRRARLQHLCGVDCEEWAVHSGISIYEWTAMEAPLTPNY